MKALRRRALFALAAVTIAFTIPFVTLLAADVYLHRKYEKSAGFNICGYRGPVAPRKKAGEYRVVVHYYSPNRNLLGGETHVNVVVTRFAGTPQEVTERHTVILKKPNEQAEVCRVKF